jgi:hypothetical protein
VGDSDDDEEEDDNNDENCIVNIIDTEYLFDYFIVNNGIARVSEELYNQ